MMIPKNIIQFWHDFTEIPALINKSLEITKNNNNNYKIIYADDKFMYNFIKMNYNESILKLFIFNKVPASRSDIARLMLLYEYGGIYIDSSMQIEENLDSFINNEADIVLVKRDDNPKYSKNKKNAHSINGFIAAKKHSKFIKRCLNLVLYNLSTGIYNNHTNITTGPIVLNQVIREYQDKYKIQYLSYSNLLKNRIKLKRIEGINNSWLQLQQEGIIPPIVYKNNSWKYQKAWFGKKIIIYFSFGFLKLN